jgi:hypothetical protein
MDAAEMHSTSSSFNRSLLSSPLPLVDSYAHLRSLRRLHSPLAVCYTRTSTNFPDKGSSMEERDLQILQYFSEPHTAVERTPFGERTDTPRIGLSNNDSPPHCNQV